MMDYYDHVRRYHRRHKMFVTGCMVLVAFSAMYAPETTHWVALVANLFWIWDPLA